MDEQKQVKPDDTDAADKPAPAVLMQFYCSRDWKREVHQLTVARGLTLRAMAIQAISAYLGIGAHATARPAGNYPPPDSLNRDKLIEYYCDYVLLWLREGNPIKVGDTRVHASMYNMSAYWLDQTIQMLLQSGRVFVSKGRIYPT